MVFTKSLYNVRRSLRKNRSGHSELENVYTLPWCHPLPIPSSIFPVENTCLDNPQLCVACEKRLFLTMSQNDSLDFIIGWWLCLKGLQYCHIRARAQVWPKILHLHVMWVSSQDADVLHTGSLETILYFSTVSFFICIFVVNCFTKLHKISQN